MSFFLFSIVISLVLIALHFFVAFTISYFFGITSKKQKVFLYTFFFLSALIVFPANLLSLSYYNFFTQFLYIYAGVWIGFFLYVFAGADLLWILYGLSLRRPWFHKKVVARIILSIAVLVGVYGLINALTIRVVPIVSPLTSVPSEWRGRRAVFVSDVHIGQVRGARFLETVREKIETLHPDVIFIGGDLFDGLSFNVDDVRDELKKLKAPLGVYFVMGNHEELIDDSNLSTYDSLLTDSGITILNNKKITIDGLDIIGVDYQSTREPYDFKNVLDSISLEKGNSSILLKHVPSNLDVAQQKGINLMLSGHTHRGQIFPGNILTYKVYGMYDYGFHAFGSMKVFTSSGVGTWFVPMRIVANPEIVQIDF